MKHHRGRIEVIYGSMFSGKTEELIRRIRRALIAKQKVQVFKPEVDTRWGLDQIKSHNGDSYQATAVGCAREILEHLERDTTVVAIDEAQFFDEGIIWAVNKMADAGIRVIIAGLALDFRAMPFGYMPTLVCMADEQPTMLVAVCMVCQAPATRTQRLVNGNPAGFKDPIILIGAEESYEARCREHHNVPGNPCRTDTPLW